MPIPIPRYSADAATHVPAHAHAGWALLPGEDVVWQGRPSVRALIERVLYGPWIAAYFALLVVLRAGEAIAFDGSARAIAAPLIPATGVALVVLVAAVTLARTTRYVVTTRRIIVRYGAALPRSLSVPFSQISSLSLTLGHGRCGDIAFDTREGLGVPPLKLWPHLRRAKPRVQLCFRGLPNVAFTATQLTRILVAAEHARRTTPTAWTTAA